MSALASVHLILLSRAPVAGETKTRLIPALGPEGARDFHVACLNDLIAGSRAWRDARGKAGGPPVEVHLFITPPASQSAFRAAGVGWPGDFALHNQRGAHLGQRMAHAISSVRKRARRTGGLPCAVVLVGTDLPLLAARQLNAAVEALGEAVGKADLVFGPTTDGGYYLVALRGEPGALFDLPDWGGGTVLADSLAQARKSGRSTALIETLPDADTPEDLRAILAHPLAKELAGRESLRWLRERIKAGGGTSPPAPP